jgi:hypothetical protein
MVDSAAQVGPRNPVDYRIPDKSEAVYVSSFFCPTTGTTSPLGKPSYPSAVATSIWASTAPARAATPKPLAPNDVWVELGKLVLLHVLRRVHLSSQVFLHCAPRSRKQIVAALEGCRDAKERADSDWDDYCLSNITSTGSIPLDKSLKAYLDKLDFSIFDAIPTLRIIDGHAKTRWHAARFGGGLPQRPAEANPPDIPTVKEMTYIRHLLDV